MARPQKEGLDYFPHDTDACTDEKVESLMMIYGTKGYAFYFIMLERIYRTSNCELDISDAETIQILSKKIGINVEEFNQILKSSIKYKCFDKEIYEKNSILTSKGIKKRSQVVIEKREKMREQYTSKNNKISDAETIEETEQKPDKVKKRKEKESKEKKSIFKEKYLECVFLSDDQYQKLVNQFGEKIANEKIQVLNNYIMSKNVKYDSHYHTILVWSRKDQQTQTPIPPVQKGRLGVKEDMSVLIRREGY
jgi:hypothetical protein